MIKRPIKQYSFDSNQVLSPQNIKPNHSSVPLFINLEIPASAKQEIPFGYPIDSINIHNYPFAGKNKNANLNNQAAKMDLDNSMSSVDDLGILTKIREEDENIDDSSSGKS